jgi:hypothetical protein
VGLKLAPILLAAGLLAGAAADGGGVRAGERFREANDLARAGDYPKAIALYEGLASGGQESASLYWNWAQTAAARGAPGEALWALLRARELDPGDRAVAREIERRREAFNLDPAEIAPDPWAGGLRVARRYHLDLAGVLLVLLSLPLHAAMRLWPAVRGASAPAGLALGLGLVLTVGSAASSLTRPVGVVIRRGAPLLDAASPTAEAVGTLREGEVVPILEGSGDYLRVEDSSGARGWALAPDVRRLLGPIAPSR